jgi:anaerobic dimethyl sulfoxide reductase subunit B (iron-sulfur subunit)
MGFYFNASACTGCKACQVACKDKNDLPVGVIWRRVYDYGGGCRYCEWACPYDAPQFNELTGVMSKCDFCQDLLAQGQNPACVDSCPMRALDFGELEELQAKYGTLNAIEPLPSGEYTSPSFVVTPHQKAEMVGEGTGHILNLAEEI